MTEKETIEYKFAIKIQSVPKLKLTFQCRYSNCYKSNTSSLKRYLNKKNQKNKTNKNEVLTFQCWRWGRWGGSDRLWEWWAWPGRRCFREAPRRSSARGGDRWATPVRRSLREDSPGDSQTRPDTLDSPVGTALSVNESIGCDPAIIRSAPANFLCGSAGAIQKFKTD